MTLTEFLLARIGEDEADAASGTPGPWRADRADVVDRVGVQVADAFDMEDSNARHIARHDPVRVLAECAAKRHIVQDHEWDETPGSPVRHSRELRHLAAVYADHPDYRDEWKP